MGLLVRQRSWELAERPVDLDLAEDPGVAIPAVGCVIDDLPLGVEQLSGGVAAVGRAGDRSRASIDEHPGAAGPAVITEWA
jgi:hypothetical protein